MKINFKAGKVRFAILLSLVLLVAFVPSGAGVVEHKLTPKQMQDSINYYRSNTMINYKLIKQRIQ